jgi:hypothetical protein
MYRHATNRVWNVAGSFHDPSRPIRRFVARPTTDDVDAFLDQARFQLRPRHGFEVLAGNVLDDHWRDATGERPLRHFARGIEQVE